MNGEIPFVSNGEIPFVSSTTFRFHFAKPLNGLGQLFGRILLERRQSHEILSARGTFHDSAVFETGFAQPVVVVARHDVDVKHLFHADWAFKEAQDVLHWV